MWQLVLNNEEEWQIKREEKMKSSRIRKEMKMKESDLVLNVKPIYRYSSFFLNGFLWSVCVCVCVWESRSLQNKLER